MTRRARIDLAALPASLLARNPPPAPAKRPGRGSAHPAPLQALPGPQGAAAGVVVVELPGLRLVNPLNNRQGWRAVSGRGKREKAATHAALMGRRAPPGPWVVTITRVSPGRLDDDGATAAAKHVRDAVATWLGVDDADHRVRFLVEQAKGPAGVRIAVGPPRADVVRLVLDRDQAGEIVRGLLSRDGGHARVECGGVVVEMTVKEAR